MKPTLHILVGISASGKSTKSKELATKHNATIVSSDVIRGEFGEVIDQSNNNEVFKIFHQRIKDNLSKGINVIADAIHAPLSYTSIPVPATNLMPSLSEPEPPFDISVMLPALTLNEYPVTVSKKIPLSEIFDPLLPNHMELF